MGQVMGMKSLCKTMNKMRDCRDNGTITGTKLGVSASDEPHRTTCLFLPLHTTSSVRAPSWRAWLGEDAGRLAQSLSPASLGVCPQSTRHSIDSLLLTKYPRGHVHTDLQPVSNLMPLIRALSLFSINCTLGHLSHGYT